MPDATETLPVGARVRVTRPISPLTHRVGEVVTSEPDHGFYEVLLDDPPHPAIRGALFFDRDELEVVA